MSRFARRAFSILAVACAATLSLPSQAQTAPIRVTGSFAAQTDSAGGGVKGTFSCSGTPTCTGQFSLVITDPEFCTNEIRFADVFVATGMNLAQSGAIQGTVSFSDLDYSDPVGARPGICTVRRGSPNVFPYVGNFDLVSGTGSFTFTAGGGSDPVQKIPATFKVDLPPVFPMVVRSAIDANTATASADIQYRPQDLGTTQSVFVFAMAPASRVQGGQAPGAMKLGFAKDDKKADTPIGCVLAQLNAAGQMVAVTSANLAAYLTGVLGAQGASVSILNGVPTGNVAGATFFVGYGTSSTAMINTGVNRAAVTVPGSLVCEPAAPETGWWWNPLEDGRGFSLEKRGNNLFFAAFLYDISGRSTWYVSSGPISLEGTLYNGDLLAAEGGQTLGGPYTRFPTLRSAGALNITFNNARTGTIVWPGGTVPIQRFNIIANGITAAPVAGVPESGWWWNPDEAGRGFFMEWQGNTLDIAGYMYDDNGNSVWYLTVGEIGGTPTARSFNGTWWSYTGGQTLTGAWRQNTRSNSNVAPLTITFSGPDTALMTLPNGRSTSLKRHRF